MRSIANGVNCDSNNIANNGYLYIYILIDSDNEHGGVTVLVSWWSWDGLKEGTRLPKDSKVEPAACVCMCVYVCICVLIVDS